MSCLVFQSGAANWYYARSRCRQQGADLAVPTSNVINTIKGKVKFLSVVFGTHQELVIGARMADWEIDGKGNEDTNFHFD